LEVKITFLCPACGNEVKANASEAGKRCFCPHCSAEMLVPFLKLGGDDRQKVLDMLLSKSAENGWIHAVDAIIKKPDRRESTRLGAEGIRAFIDEQGPFRVVNISCGGAAIELPVEKTSGIGRAVNIEIDNPFSGGRVRVKAQVMWLTLVMAFDGSTPVGNGAVYDKNFVRMGLSFLEMSLEDKAVLDKIRQAISY